MPPAKDVVYYSRRKSTTPPHKAGWAVYMAACFFGGSTTILSSVTCRTIVYVDGFNLYYGAVRGSPHKWLDLQRYFRRLRNNDQIAQIYYFTALIAGATRPNQETYLRALDTLPVVTVVLGRFKDRWVQCNVRDCCYSGSRWFPKPEEKRTDVSIGIQMLDDAYRGRCDTMVLVSGDSDLVPAVSRVKTRFPDMSIVVYVPTRNPVRGAAVELRSAADKHRDLPLQLLRHCQFPPTVADGAGGVIQKPADW